MTEKTFIVIGCILIVASLVLVGCIGGDCVEECNQAGNSLETCFNICRP